MESIAMADHEDQPTNSTEEEDQDTSMVGLGGRSYECMFCRRGFTTAQALGGHMNIHRKDRAKTRPSSKQDHDHGCYGGPRFYQPVFATCPPPNHLQEGQVRYRTYFSSTSSVRPMNDYENNQDSREAMPTEERSSMSLSLQFGRCHGEDKDLKRRIRYGDEEDEVDLELRLGHDP